MPPPRFIVPLNGTVTFLVFVATEQLDEASKWAASEAVKIEEQYGEEYTILPLPEESYTD